MVMVDRAGRFDVVDVVHAWGSEKGRDDGRTT